MTMATFLIPLMLSNALQLVGQLIGTIVVGRWIGVSALAAISAFFLLFFLLVSFAIGVSAGSSILIGQAYGARNREQLKAIVGTWLTFTFLLRVVLAVFGGVFTWDILRFIGTPQRLQVDACMLEIGRRERIGQMNGIWRDVVLLNRRSKMTGTS